MKTVTILTEGGRKTGLGHISRCAALYEAFEECECEVKMIVNGEESVKTYLRDKQVILNDWYSENELLNWTDSDVIIVDSYFAGKKLYETCSQNFSCLVYLDDDIRIEYPRGIVVNGAVYAEEMDYPSNLEIKYLLGNRFTLLRKEFWDVPESIINSEVMSVLITLGGNDERNLIPDLVRRFRKYFPLVKLSILVSAASKSDIEIEQMDGSNIEVIHGANASKMKHLMMNVDLAVSAAGQTLGELARVGVPTIAIEVADNQKGNVRGWTKAGFIASAFRWDDVLLSEKIIEQVNLMVDPEVRGICATAGQNSIDGQGARRVAKYCMDAINQV